MCFCPLFPSLLSPPVLAELQQASLITSVECEGLRYPRDMVQVQIKKSLEVQTKTADVLRRYGLEKESNLLAGKQAQMYISVPGVLYSGA